MGGSNDIRSERVGIGARGRFLELDEPSVIRMTWCWMNNGVSAVEEEVRVELTPHEGGTRVTLTHDLDELAGDGADQRQGWQQVLARLAEIADAS